VKIGNCCLALLDGLALNIGAAGKTGQTLEKLWKSPHNAKQMHLLVDRLLGKVT
jgi:hypothetical protein